MAQDYYKTLGVNRDADDKAIKLAFRRLAKKHHPDANPNDPAAESRFKEINEAHEVLSDKKKRADYDRFGTATPGVGFGGAPAGGGGAYTTTNMDFGDLSDMLGSIFGRGRSGGGAGGANVGNPFASGNFSTQADGNDIEHPVSISLREAYTSTTRMIKKGERTIRVNIPAGAKTGTRVRLTGEGEAGMGGGRPGDLYLLIAVEPDTQFERDGDDLTVNVRVDLFTALLGGEIEVPTLGKTLKLKIPAGTSSGRNFRLTGKGMPILNRPDAHGDLFARILVSVPDQLTDEQRTLIEQLRATF